LGAGYTPAPPSPSRRGRAARLRTDLGGLYFNAIVAVVITGVWWLTRYDALLLVVATQVLQMVRQLTPLVRFDGYHVLADVTGVPDLFHRIKPTLLSALPWRSADPEANALKPWARVVVTLWVVAVVPMLLFSFGVLVVTLPRVLATAWVKLHEQSAAAGAAIDAGHITDVAARALAMVAIAFPVLAAAVLLVRLGRSAATGVWRRTQGSPGRRAVAGALALALAAGLAYAWWPTPGTYRPVRPYERGAITDLAAFSGGDSAGLREGRTGEATAIWPADEPRPTAEHPRLALVLVPRGAQSGAGAGSPAASAPAWVFPFDKPLAPGPGDNQALAVNTTDDTVAYDVAMALVWVEDGNAALNRNEAFAAASCDGCAAVAIAFQVVLVVGQTDVAVPQNLSTAVTYDCRGCLTYALAVQLFVTLDGPLDDASSAALQRLWSQIAAFGEQIDELPLSQIQSRLNDFEQQILAIVRPATSTPAPASTATSSATGASTADPSASATVASTATQGTGSDGGSGSQPTSTASADLPSSTPTDSASASATATGTSTAAPTAAG
jgi:putative peptide zinc metalloprotease protein